ncbi:hypothetical protein [Thalassovita taeanensis]|uniref:hypothetical protein n=1 Tax=Thalassovita taeanensis TaxID=657014 RepID=UPI001C316F73|nr:hypothetical protein [Thalassovita taeanensis]
MAFVQLSLNAAFTRLDAAKAEARLQQFYRLHLMVSMAAIGIISKDGKPSQFSKLTTLLSSWEARQRFAFFAHLQAEGISY